MKKAKAKRGAANTEAKELGTHLCGVVDGIFKKYGVSTKDQDWLFTCMMMARDLAAITTTK